ncbi:hypothetical protein U0070_025128 [Myodes glareolus]|uniref:Galactosyltransferase N-terminal domain-containing protein n=1 Tax=Myodes glareolus TaxID=447135 RepID=A0AAW0I7T6_MYOGA
MVLQHQQLDYGVCVTKKARDTMFNCAKFLSVDFPGALKEHDHPCFVFSNADLFPWTTATLTDLLITWAWGGEKDVSNRLVYRGMFLSCPSTVFGRHEPYPEGFDRLAHTKQMVHLDDFSSLIYQVLDKHKYLLHSKLTVDVGTPRKQS